MVMRGNAGPQCGMNSTAHPVAPRLRAHGYGRPAHKASGCRAACRRRSCRRRGAGAGIAGYAESIAADQQLVQQRRDRQLHRRGVAAGIADAALPGVAIAGQLPADRSTRPDRKRWSADRSTISVSAATSSVARRSRPICHWAAPAPPHRALGRHLFRAQGSRSAARRRSRRYDSATRWPSSSREETKVSRSCGWPAIKRISSAPYGRAHRRYRCLSGKKSWVGFHQKLQMTLHRRPFRRDDREHNGIAQAAVGMIWWLRSTPSCLAPKRAMAARERWLNQWVRNSTRTQPRVWNACASSSDLASVLMPVRCTERAYQV